MPAPPRPLRVPVRAARRLAVEAARLGGPLPARRRPAPADQVLETVQALGLLQLDPTPAVARSPLLVLRARLGPVDAATLDHLAYAERALFDYWAHDASLVCASDAAIHRSVMARWPWRDGPATRRRVAWFEANASFRTALLDQLRAEGPLAVREIEDRSRVPWSGGWAGEKQAVGAMVDTLWLRGEIGVADRLGGRRRWDLAERVLPTPGVEPLEHASAVERAAARALRMLGVARAAHLRVHFTRNRYPGLPAALARLHARGEIRPVAVDGLGEDWWVHAADEARLREHAAPGTRFRGRTVLLSPFDSLLCDRARAAQLFGFDHRLEIYTPKARRRWGYFVMPLLHRDALVGRADLLVDRREGVLRVHAYHPEPRAPRGALGGLVRDLERIAAWRGAERVELPAGL